MEIYQITILKGLPLSYFKDLQDDKEIVFKSNDTLISCLKIFDEILKNSSPNKKKNDWACKLWIYYCNRFGRLSCQESLNVFKKKKLNELSLEELKKIEPKLTNDVLKVFDLKNSVNSKKSYGGTAFKTSLVNFGSIFFNSSKLSSLSFFFS